MNPKHQYDRIGKTYIEQKERTFTGNPDRTTTFFTDHLQLEDRAVLDLGCGGGTEITAYEDAGAHCHGIDISAFMISEARKRVRHPQRLHVASIERLPFRSETFDMVLSRFGFHYEQDLTRSYQEASRVLKPGGIFGVILPHPSFDAYVNRQKYDQRFLVETLLFDGKVKLVYPHHTIEDYLSPSFNALFALRIFSEFNERGSETPDWQVPCALGIIAEKKAR